MSKSALTIVHKYGFAEVAKVVDATSDALLVVEGEDVDAAVPLDPRNCAMARACARQIDGCNGAIIGISGAYVIRGDTAYRYITPQRVAREIVSFDRNSRFAKGNYYLKHPHATGKLGGRPNRKRGKNSGERPRGPKRVVAADTAGIRQL